MIGGISTNTQSYAQSRTTHSVKKDKTFGDLLSSAVNEANAQQCSGVAEQAIEAMKKQLGVYNPYQTEQPIQIPERWVTEDSVALTGENRAVEYLKQNGIDVSQLQPTHEITPEQMEWLKSRHDFAAISVHGNNADYQNLCGDLIALNVFSLEEVRDMFLVAVPEGDTLRKAEPSAVGFSDVGIQGLGSGLGSLRQAFQYSMNTQESILSAFLKGIKNLAELSVNDQKFVQRASALLSQKQQFYDILLGLFES